MSRKKLWTTSTSGEFLTPWEFAQRTNVSEATVYRHLLAGRLEGIRIGGTLWRLPVSQLFPDEQVTGSHAPQDSEERRCPEGTKNG